MTGALHEAQAILTPSLSTTVRPVVVTIGKRHNARDRRVRFALFVKILFKELEDVGEVRLSAKAKHLLRLSTQMNRIGHPSFQPLLDTLEKRLRELVGEVHWRRSHAYMRYYLSQREEASLLI